MCSLRRRPNVLIDGFFAKIAVINLANNISFRSSNMTQVQSLDHRIIIFSLYFIPYFDVKKNNNP